MINEFFPHRITGEPLFGTTPENFTYAEEQLGYGSSSNEHSPSAIQMGFDFHPHPADLSSFLSAAIGHQSFLHGAADFNPDESDDGSDDEDVSETSDDVDIDEDDDDDDDDNAQSDGDEDSVGEPNEQLMK